MSPLVLNFNYTIAMTQYGHFDDERREYVITRPDKPRSWANCLGSMVLVRMS